MKEAFKKHFQPKKLIMAERSALLTKTQKPIQSLQRCYVELQKASNECRFENVQNDRNMVVTTIFIGWLTSDERRKRLLEREEVTS